MTLRRPGLKLMLAARLRGLKVSQSQSIPTASSHFINIHYMAQPYAADHAPRFVLDFGVNYLLTYLLTKLCYGGLLTLLGIVV